MRRTLTVLVASAALLVPATAASAAPTHEGKTNASCNSGQQRGPEGFSYNGAGKAAKGEGCSGDVATDDKPKSDCYDAFGNYICSSN